MLAQNSSNGKFPNNSKSAKPNSNPAPKVGIKTRSTTKKSVIGVSNISVSIRSSKKATDSSKRGAVSTPELVPISKSEVGIQVDEVEIIANDCGQGSADTGDMVAPIIRLPSAKVIKEIERYRKQKKDQQLKARLSETRKFEVHAAKQELHLTNLKEFLDTGAISRKRDNEDEPEPEKTKSALEAYDRIKIKEEELMKLFNSI